MGKKKKRTSTLLNSSNSVSSDEFSSFQDEIIQHLRFLKESGGLVVGCNAVLRGIEKNSLSVVIFISRRGTSAMYHALNFMCKGRDVLFLQLQDINSILLNSKIPSSTSYGVKTSVIYQPKFSKLLEKINTAKNSRKSHKEKEIDKLNPKSKKPCLGSENPCLESDNTFLESKIHCQTSELMNNIIHSKHDLPEAKFSGKEGFLSLNEIDFPNYRTKSNQISVRIK